jgi:hypothetical protein
LYPDEFGVDKMTYPFETKKATKWTWSLAWMAGHEITYVGLPSKKETIIPRLIFRGVEDARSRASVDNIRDLAEGVQMVINHAAKACGLRKINSGLAMNPFSEYHNEDNIAWDFAVFPRDKDRAKITVRVYTNDIHGGSCVISCPPLVMSDIPSMAQFKTALETAYQWGMSQSKKYTRLNLPPENPHARPD